METINPRASVTKAERKRIPMSTPVSKLAVPDVPGYHLHWFSSAADRIARALDAGYEFVDNTEVKPNAVDLGQDSAVSGNTDMGSRVSVVAGKQVDAEGQAIRLVLMKIKQEWWEADQKLVEQRNDLVADSLKGGLTGGAQAQDANELHQRYVSKDRTKLPDLFTKGLMARKNRPLKEI